MKIESKTNEEIQAHIVKMRDSYDRTGKDIYLEIKKECEAELSRRAQKKSEPQPIEKSEQLPQTPQPKDAEQERERQNKAAFFEARREQATAQAMHQEQSQTLSIATPPADLGALEVDEEQDDNPNTLDIPMVNGTTFKATYGTVSARGRQYFENVLDTNDFREKRYAAVLKLTMFRNLVRLVKGWGVLKSLDKNNPDYPTLYEVFKVQRQTREDRIEKARILLQMVLERIEDKKE